MVVMVGSRVGERRRRERVLQNHWTGYGQREREATSRAPVFGSDSWKEDAVIVYGHGEVLGKTMF